MKLLNINLVNDKEVVDMDFLAHWMFRHYDLNLLKYL